MKITLICFSQTGNTRKITNALCDAFEKSGHSVLKLDMQKVAPEELLPCDLLGVGCPTFECTAPTPVKAFLSSLVMQENQRAFVFATGGGASGNVLQDLSALLKKKGAIVTGAFLSPGEIHHPAPCLLGKTPLRPNAEDLDKAKRFAVSIPNLLAGEKFSPEQTALDSGLKRKKGFYNFIGLIGSSNKMIRFLEPKPKNNQAICKKCNLCVEQCPVGNLSMNPYPEHRNNCIRCYRCVNVCPSKAISVNWSSGNVLLFALYNETFMGWFGEYEK